MKRRIAGLALAAAWLAAAPAAGQGSRERMGVLLHACMTAPTAAASAELAAAIGASEQRRPQQNDPPMVAEDPARPGQMRRVSFTGEQDRTWTAEGRQLRLQQYLMTSTPLAAGRPAGPPVRERVVSCQLMLFTPAVADRLAEVNESLEGPYVVVLGRGGRMITFMGDMRAGHVSTVAFISEQPLALPRAPGGAESWTLRVTGGGPRIREPRPGLPTATVSATALRAALNRPGVTALNGRVVTPVR